MKKILILILILQAYTHLMAQNQEEITTRFQIYQVDIWIKGTTKLVHGVLFSVDDTTLTISNSSRRYDYVSGNYETTAYPLDQIIEVKSYRLAGGDGAMIGMVGGGVIGGLIGKLKEKRYFGQLVERKVERYALFGGFFGGTLGLITGRKWIRGVPEPNSKILRKLKARAIKR